MVIRKPLTPGKDEGLPVFGAATVPVMSMSSSTTWHLECDICHADGGETVSEHEPDRPDDWHRVKILDICPACTDRMTFRDFLAYWDELVRKSREDQQRRWDEHAKARREILRSSRVAG